MQSVKCLSVLVPMTEAGVRRLNEWLQSGWFFVEGFEGTDQFVAILEKPTRTDLNDWNEDLEEEDEDRDW